MAETVIKEARPAQQMSEFGRTLYSLMLTRGVEHRQDLLKKLREEGRYPISQARLSYYLNGERSVDPKFLVYVSELLRLNQAERRRLAWAFAYGQFEPDEAEQEQMRAIRSLL